MHYRRGRLTRLALMAGFMLAGALPATTQAASNANPNDMMCGGASSPTQFAHKLDHGDGCGHRPAELQRLYTMVDANVTAKNITNGNTTTGSVTKNGQVLVDGKVVATGAISYGRINLSGSQAVGSASDPLYGRPPAVSFASSSLPALVHMVDGRFRYAIIESCGNLITATPKIVAAAKAAPVVAAAPTVSVTQVQIQAQTQTQAQTPAPTPAPVQVVATTKPVATTPLPQTGATATGLVGLSLLLTVGWYWRRSRRGLALALRLPQLPH